jgi:hypothetical protein
MTVMILIRLRRLMRMMAIAQKMGSRLKLLVWTERKKKVTLMLMGTL